MSPPTATRKGPSKGLCHPMPDAQHTLVDFGGIPLIGSHLGNALGVSWTRVSEDAHRGVDSIALGRAVGAASEGSRLVFRRGSVQDPPEMVIVLAPPRKDPSFNMGCQRTFESLSLKYFATGSWIRWAFLLTRRFHDTRCAPGTYQS